MLGLLRCLVAIVLAALTGPALAHEGHDHGAPPPPVSASVAPRGDASSADFEIVAIARGGELEIALDRLRSNEPVENAAIEIDTAAGILKPTHRGHGIYVVSTPFLRRAGTHQLAFTVIAGDIVDVLPVTLDIPPAAPASAAIASSSSVAVTAPSFGIPGIIGAILIGFMAGVAAARSSGRKAIATAGSVLVAALATPITRAEAAEPNPVSSAPVVASRDVAQRLADGAVFVPKGTQRILAIRTAFTTIDAHHRSIDLPGRIIPDPNASGLVQASVGGRLSPPESGFKPLGTVVKAGDVLAYVRAPLPAADATAQAQQARELDQQISITSRKVERLSAIQQVIAKSQLEDAQLELKGLRERRANLERVNREPEPLIAPVSGVIASANAIAGQMAEPSSVIFQIIDPARLWVEALAFEPQALSTDASARTSDGRQLTLAYLGTGLSDRNQAVPVHFAITGSASGLRTGQFVSVFAGTTDVRKGVALPRSAVLRGANGQAIVYEHTNAERFVPREVRTLGLDGERVLVVSGLDAGKRIVTQGAELLDQIR